ncbi:MAG: beta-lactamase family protein [Candidatus Lokiarchaeota archaeon]|nr:beta-lactamase family protein [Candidatus Lokiarchaeota archaeon]
MDEKIEIHGFCDERFAAVKEAFQKNFKNSGEVGASFAATINGKFVVDIWGGYADKARSRSWEKDSIINVFSTTKVMTIICALMLVDGGQLDLDAPVAKYWPEFAQNGKEKIPVRQIFSHTSGLAGWEEKITMEDLYDWEKAVRLLAAQKPWWEPGTSSGYHAITHGYLLGEIVRRITGKSLGTFFKEEVSGPLNADFHIGFGKDNDNRVADLISYDLPQKGEPGYFEMDPQSFFSRVFTNPVIDIEKIKTREWRAAEIPAAGGHGNARSVARIASAIACGGGVDNIQLLKMETIKKAMEEQSYTPDLVLMMPIRFGIGFGLPSKEIPLPSPNTIWWGGAGGSMVVMDLDNKLSLSYVMNQMSMVIVGDPRSLGLITALYEGLSK